MFFHYRGRNNYIKIMDTLKTRFESKKKSFDFLNVIHPKFDSKNHSLEPLLRELPSPGGSDERGCHGRCELNEVGERGSSRWLLERKRQKTRIFFLWQWGWVQIRSCGRDSGGIRVVLEGRRESDIVRELWERVD